MPIGSAELDDGVDIITGSDFAGLTTFANLPYANCFVDEVIEAYDVAILGAPFDTVSPPELYLSFWIQSFDLTSCIVLFMY